MNTRSSRAPRSVTPHGNDHDCAAVVAHGAVARPPPSSNEVIWCSTASSPPSISTIADASGASTMLAERDLDPAAGRHLHDRGRRRLRRRLGGRWSSGAAVVVVEAPDVSGATGGAAKPPVSTDTTRLAVLVGGVGDDHHVVGEPVVGGGAAGAVPGGREGVRAVWRPASRHRPRPVGRRRRLEVVVSAASSTRPPATTPPRITSAVRREDLIARSPRPARPRLRFGLGGGVSRWRRLGLRRHGRVGLGRRGRAPDRPPTIRWRPRTAGGRAPGAPTARRWPGGRARRSGRTGFGSEGSRHHPRRPRSRWTSRTARSGRRLAVDDELPAVRARRPTGAPCCRPPAVPTSGGDRPRRGAPRWRRTGRAGARRRSRRSVGTSTDDGSSRARREGGLVAVHGEPRRHVERLEVELTGEGRGEAGRRRDADRSVKGAGASCSGTTT